MRRAAAALLCLACCSAAVGCLSTFGYALRFRWSSHAVVDGGCSFVPQSAFTYSLWVKPYTIAESLALIGTLATGPGGEMDFRNSALRVVNGEAAFVAAIQGKSELQTLVSAPIQTSRWNHVAVTFQAGDAGGTARMFVNGQLVANATQTGSINALSDVSSSACRLLIAQDGIDDILFVGEMDEIQAWSRTLTPSEVTLRYRSQLLGVEPGLVLYLVGDGDNRTHVIDHSQHAHHARAVAGTRYNGLSFFSYAPDCVGCFDSVFPRCAPWHTTSDACGDGQITGAEECEQGDTNCQIDCKCPSGMVPSISVGGCVMAANGTCTAADIDVCAGASACGTDCPCILEQGLGCLTERDCSLYDMPSIGVIAWGVCLSACTTTIVQNCFGNVPETCLIYRSQEECALASGQGCSWCIDHCADSAAECMEMCGNGATEAINAETCDDGNAANGDGCSAACIAEPGYNCTSGTCVTVCGDGVLAGSELCDDANGASGDGCNSSCMVESGWTCNTSTTPTRCTKPTFWTPMVIALIAGGGGALVLVVAAAVGIAVACHRHKKKHPKKKRENKPIEHTVTAVILEDQGLEPAGAIALDPVAAGMGFVAVSPEEQQQQQMMLDQQALYSSPFPQQQLQPQHGVASFAGWGDAEEHPRHSLHPPGQDSMM